MTPKEKADELIAKFVNIETLKDFEGMDEIHAKQCAIICVKEILNSDAHKPIIKMADDWYQTPLNYWQEVKEEITKL